MDEVELERRLVSASARVRAVTTDDPVDLWPRIRDRLTDGHHVAPRVSAAIVFVAVGLVGALMGASFAFAWPRILPLIVVQTNTAISISPTHAQLTGSVAEAERRAGFTINVATGYPDAELSRVEYVEPTRTVQGKAVENPQPAIRLTYLVGSQRIIVTETRNPLPGQPATVALIGEATGFTSESVANGQRLVMRAPDGSGVMSMFWATEDLWISVVFERGAPDSIAQRFVSALH